MNDDSNKNPPNTGWKAHLEDLARQAKTQSQELKQARSDMNLFQVINEVPEDLINKLKGSVPSHAEVAVRLPKTRQKIINMVESKRGALNAQAERHISSEFSASAVNGLVKEQKYSPEVSAMSASMVNLPYEELQAREKKLLNGIEVFGGEAKAAARTVITGHTMSDPRNIGRPGALNTIGQKIEDRDRAVTELAAIAQQKEFRKSQGLDPRSQEMMASKYYGMMKQSQLETDIKRDQAVKFQDPTTGQDRSVKLGAEVISELENQIKGVVENFKKLETATAEEAQAIKKNTEARMDTVQKLEVGKEIGGGGRFGGLSEKGWGKIAGIFALASAIGDTTKIVGVDHRIAEKANEAGMASLVNQKYETYKAARGGDIASQLLLSKYEKAQEFGESVKGWGLGAEALSKFGKAGIKFAGAGLAAAGASATATGTAAAISTGVGAILAPLGISGTTAMAGAAGGLTLSGAADVAEGISSMGRGVESGQNYIRGVSTDLEAKKQINAIPAEQMQGLRDFYVGAGTVAQGMGSKANSFLSEVTGEGIRDKQLMQARQGVPVDKSLIEKMADASISPEQMIQMAQLGVNTVGSQFSTDQVFAGRTYEKAGFGSMEQNMQRMGRLADAGSNNPQAGLESVMAAAMTKGLDGSKTLNMMVDNTAAMVSQTQAAAAGIDTTAVTAAALAAQVDPEAKNKEFATERAMTVQQIARQADTNVSTTFSGMMNTARISQATGLSGIDAITAGETTASEWKALQNDPDAEKKLRSMGISVKEGGGQELINKMINLKQRQVAEGAGAANAMGGLSDSLFEKLKGDTLLQDDPEYDQAAKIARRSGYKTVEEYQRAVKSGDANVIPDDELQKKLKPGEGKPGDPKDLLKELDALRTGGLKQLSEAAGSAATSLNQIGGALKVFTELNEKYKKGGPETEKEFATAAGKAADKFEIGADKFGTQVTRLEGILNNVIKQSGMYIPEPEDDTVRAGAARAAETH